MINLVIDTTCLRNDPARKKAAFRALKKLTDVGELRLHISQIVMQEFLSQQTEQYLAGLSEIIAKSAKFKQKNIPHEIRQYLSGMEEHLNGLKEELAAFAKADFDEWVSDLCAEVHPISESHGQKVMQAYFSGEAPFRERKRREDIPDAFIWQIIIDLAEQFSQLYVISNDGAIQIACEAHTNIVSFRTLDEFISSEICQTPLKKAQAKSNFERILVMAPEIIDEIKRDVVSEAIDALHGKTVTSERIPDDNNEATIMLIGDPREIEMLTDDAEYYGDGLFVIPISFYSECLVNYALFKSDFYVLDDERAAQISISDLNEHYFDVEEYYDLFVKGLVAVNLGSEAIELEGVNDDQLRGMLEEVEINLDSIEEIEVPSDVDY